MYISLRSTVARTQSVVQENIIPGLSAKQPKTVAGCVAALKEIIRYAMTLTDNIEFRDINSIITDCLAFKLRRQLPFSKYYPRSLLIPTRQFVLKVPNWSTRYISTWVQASKVSFRTSSRYK